MAATTAPRPIYQIGQTIYHRVDGESRGIITGIIIRPDHFIYYVVWGDRMEMQHYEMELSDERGFGTEGGGVGEN